MKSLKQYGSRMSRHTLTLVAFTAALLVLAVPSHQPSAAAAYLPETPASEGDSASRQSATLPASQKSPSFLDFQASTEPRDEVGEKERLGDSPAQAEASEEVVAAENQERPDQGITTANLPMAPLEEILNSAPVFKAGCSSQACGNTGNTYGYGSSCAAAKADLAARLNAEAYSICPGVVTGVSINYGGCSWATPLPGCKFSGNANISCKICPGQSCELDE